MPGGTRVRNTLPSAARSSGSTRRSRAHLQRFGHERGAVDERNAAVREPAEQDGATAVDEGHVAQIDTERRAGLKRVLGHPVQLVDPGASDLAGQLEHENSVVRLRAL